MIDIGAIDEFLDGSPKRLEVEGKAVCVVRLGGQVYAIGDTCSHQNFSLSGGEVWADQCQIECPAHGARFDLATGDAVTLPATEPVASYQVVVQDGRVQIQVTDE